MSAVAEARAVDVPSRVVTGSMAVALALFTVEALTNIFKHAFPAGKTGRDQGHQWRRSRAASFGWPSPMTAPASGDEPPTGTGLSIVHALVRDELRGTLDMKSGPGTRAEVVFPA